MRTIGALGKPKYIRVKISDINNIFKPDAEIDISISYTLLFNNTEHLSPVHVPYQKNETNIEQAEEKIEFTIK